MGSVGLDGLPPYKRRSEGRRFVGRVEATQRFRSGDRGPLAVPCAMWSRMQAIGIRKPTPEDVAPIERLITDHFT